MEAASPVTPRWFRWARATAVVVPAWLHIAWMIWVVPPLGAVVSENVFGLLTALWFIPVGFTLYGLIRKWVPEWVAWAFVVLPYGAILLWAALGTD